MTNFSRRGIISKIIPFSFLGFISNSYSETNNIKKIQNSTKKTHCKDANDRYSTFVDDFGADPSGQFDSTEAVIAAAMSINGSSTSGYDGDVTSYGEVVFGNGTYILGDVPFFTGIKYRGQGKFATRVVPKEGASFCFVTTKMDKNRLYQSGIENMTIGAGYQNIRSKNSRAIHKSAGGIYINEASYFTLSNIVCRYLDGPGLSLGNVWDSDFTNLRIMECGNISDQDNPTPGLLIGPGTSKDDGTNAVRFYGFHIESCPQLMQILHRTRHVFFISPKIESHDTDAVSSTIIGTRGVTFDCPELTWFRSDLFMFDMVRKSSVDDNQLLCFNSPTLISNMNYKGSYFLYDSRITPLVINNAQMRGVARLASGRNINIIGGTSCFSGPGLVSGCDNIIIQGVCWKSISKPKYINIPVISLNGSGCCLSNNRFEFEGDIDDGFTGITFGKLCGDARIVNNSFDGAKSTVISLHKTAAETAIVYGNRSINNGRFSSIISGRRQVFPFLSPDTSNKSIVELDSLTIEAGAEYSFGDLTSGNIILVSATWVDSFFKTYVDSAMVLMNNNTDIIRVMCNLLGKIKDDAAGMDEPNFLYITKEGKVFSIVNKLQCSVKIKISSCDI